MGRTVARHWGRATIFFGKDLNHWTVPDGAWDVGVLLLQGLGTPPGSSWLLISVCWASSFVASEQHSALRVCALSTLHDKDQMDPTVGFQHR